MHEDNKTVIKERIFWDKSNPDTLRNDITTIDQRADSPVDNHENLPSRR